MSTATLPPALDTRLVKALAHPLRQQVLTLLNERVASPSEMAEEFDAPLGTVSYHVRTLLDLGCIELVRTTPRRGAVEHHYRALVRAAFDDEQWAQMPASARRVAHGAELRAIVKNVVKTAESDGFDGPEDVVVRLAADLDAKGRAALTKALQATQAKVEKIAADSAKRGSADAVPVEVALLGFASRSKGRK